MITNMDATHAFLRRGDALRDGHTDYEIRRQYTRGHWQRLGHGCYLPQEAFEAIEDVERHRLLIDSTLPTMAADAVVSHQSAAVLYGLPTWRAPLDRVHITRDRRNGGRIRSALAVHCAPIADEVVDLDGMLLTSPARTIVDLARTLPFEVAVAIGDAALGGLAMSPGELACELELAKCRRGIARSRLVVTSLDGRSESVGESRSRLLLARSTLPTVRSQGNVYDAAGKFLGRVDFYLTGCAVVGEFDGRGKYLRYLSPGQESGRVESPLMRAKW